MGGMVLETNMSEILTHIEAQNKIEKSELPWNCFFLMTSQSSQTQMTQSTNHNLQVNTVDSANPWEESRVHNHITF